MRAPPTPAGAAGSTTPATPVALICTRAPGSFKAPSCESSGVPSRPSPSGSPAPLRGCCADEGRSGAAAAEAGLCTPTPAADTAAVPVLNLLAIAPWGPVLAWLALAVLLLLVAVLAGLASIVLRGSAIAAGDVSSCCPDVLVFGEYTKSLTLVAAAWLSYPLLSYPLLKNPLGMLALLNPTAASLIVCRPCWLRVAPAADGPRHACQRPVKVRPRAVRFPPKPEVESRLLRFGADIVVPCCDDRRVSAKLRYVDARLCVTVTENSETAATAARSAAPADAVTPFLSVALNPALRFKPMRDLSEFNRSQIRLQCWNVSSLSIPV